MKSQISQHRPYQEVGALIRDLIADIARPRAPCRCAAIIDNDSHFIVALPAQW